MSGRGVASVGSAANGRCRLRHGRRPLVWLADGGGVLPRRLPYRSIDGRRCWATSRHGDVLRHRRRRTLSLERRARIVLPSSDGHGPADDEGRHTHSQGETRLRHQPSIRDADATTSAAALQRRVRLDERIGTRSAAGSSAACEKAHPMHAPRSHRRRSRPPTARCERDPLGAWWEGRAMPARRWSRMPYGREKAR